jgi:hypothetical protein
MDVEYVTLKKGKCVIEGIVSDLAAPGAEQSWSYDDAKRTYHLHLKYEGKLEEVKFYYTNLIYPPGEDFKRDAHTSIRAALQKIGAVKNS